MGSVDSAKKSTLQTALENQTATGYVASLEANSERVNQNANATQLKAAEAKEASADARVAKADAELNPPPTKTVSSGKSTKQVPDEKEIARINGEKQQAEADKARAVDQQAEIQEKINTGQIGLEEALMNKQNADQQAKSAEEALNGFTRFAEANEGIELTKNEDGSHTLTMDKENSDAVKATLQKVGLEPDSFGAIENEDGSTEMNFDSSEKMMDFMQALEPKDKAENHTNADAQPTNHERKEPENPGLSAY